MGRATRDARPGCARPGVSGAPGELTPGCRAVADVPQVAEPDTALAEALRAGASGIHTAEAGVSLLINCEGWLPREDFTSQFITTAAGATLMAAIDWQAAITALDHGQLPCSSGERHMLKLAASIAGGTPVSLSDTLTGIDHHNSSLVIKTIVHATGARLPRNGTSPAAFRVGTG